jgi:hypothetical protein
MAGDTPSGFTYDSLPTSSCFRLLERLDSASDGTLCFALLPYDDGRDERVSYYCLSYTWGNPFAHGDQFREHFDAVAPLYDEKNQVRVLVNGQAMFVQKNLYDALSMLPQDTLQEWVNSPRDNTNGRTLLHNAAGRGDVSMIETWLKVGADINKLNDEGHNALHYAAGNGQPASVPVLLQNGCRRDVKDMKGQTPLDLARKSGYNEVVARLEESPPQPDSQGVICRVIRKIHIWADAICINQNDIDEKSAQVAMMDRIYSSATYVIAWLGPSDKHSDVAIQTLNTLSSHLKAFKDSEIEPFSGKDKDKYTEASVPYISQAEWVSLGSLYQRQWFRRAWIVQEALLPPSLLMYVGEKTIQWRELGLVSDAIRYNEAKLGTSRSTDFVPIWDIAVPITWNMAELAKWRGFVTRAREENDKAMEYRALFNPQLSYNFITFLASDPRDKFFAYYGLLNLFATERKQTDYRLSIPAVYTRVTRELIASEGNLHALSWCVYSRLRRCDLPSWVPDYNLSGVNAVPKNFSADKGLEYIQPRAIDLDCPVLHVKGAFLGNVSQVGGRPGTGNGEKLQFDRSWLTLPLSLRGNSKCNVLSDILWRTLCMNMSIGSVFDPGVYGDQAPNDLGIQFRYFLLLLILAAADGKIREKLGLEITTKHELIFSHLDYDPMKEDMEPVLADLDAFEEHDGPGCWLPSRKEVLEYWNNYIYNLLRNTVADEDGGTCEFYLPDGVTEENSRPIGNGYVLPTILARRYDGFISAYSLMYGGRQLITVENTSLGLASISTKPGDEVWQLPGLNAPVVLRLISTVQRNGKCVHQYQFLGSCFLWGLMYGSIAEVFKDKVVDLELV